MAVQVPEIQRFQGGGGLPQNERIQIKSADQSQNILSRTNAIGNLAEKGADIYQEFENDKIKQLTQEAEMEYKTWNDEQLTKLKNYEGDPTDIYNQYETAAKEKYDSILAARPDLNDRVKRHLTAGLDNIAGNERVTVLKQRGAQQETYANNLYESNVKMKKDNLGTTASFIRKDDPGSYLEFDKNLAEIRTTIAQRSIDKGLGEVLPEDAKSWSHMYTDPEGKVVKVKLNDIAKQRTAKELSEGVSSSINSMIAAGYTQEAEQAREKYKAYLDPKSAASLDNKFKTAGVKQTAYDEVSNIEGKSESDQMRYIESIKDPEVKSEVLKIKDTNDRRRENIRQRQFDRNYETLGSRILAKQNSGNPFYGMADLENDQGYKALYDRMDVKGKKAIEQMVIAPKTTDPKAEIALQNMFFGEDPDNKIEDMTPETFNSHLVGLSKSDRNKYTNMYNRAKNPSSGEESASLKRAGSMLQEQLLVDGHITKNKFGKLSADDEITYLGAKNRLIDALDKQGPMSAKETKDFVKSFSVEEIKGKIYSPAAKTPFNAPSNTPKASPITPVAGKEKQVVLSQKQLLQLQKDFRKQYGTFPSMNDPKFKTFVQNNS